MGWTINLNWCRDFWTINSIHGPSTFFWSLCGASARDWALWTPNTDPNEGRPYWQCFFSGTFHNDIMGWGTVQEPDFCPLACMEYGFIATCLNSEYSEDSSWYLQNTENATHTLWCSLIWCSQEIACVAMPLMRCLRQAWCWSTGVVGILFGMGIRCQYCCVSSWFILGIYHIHTQNLLYCVSFFFGVH